MLHLHHPTVRFGKLLSSHSKVGLRATSFALGSYTCARLIVILAGA